MAEPEPKSEVIPENIKPAFAIGERVYGFDTIKEALIRINDQLDNSQTQHVSNVTVTDVNPTPIDLWEIISSKLPYGQSVHDLTNGGDLSFKDVDGEEVTMNIGDIINSFALDKLVDKIVEVTIDSNGRKYPLKFIKVLDKNGSTRLVLLDDSVTLCRDYYNIPINDRSMPGEVTVMDKAILTNQLADLLLRLYPEGMDWLNRELLKQGVEIPSSLNQRKPGVAIIPSLIYFANVQRFFTRVIEIESKVHERRKFLKRMLSIFAGKTISKSEVISIVDVKKKFSKSPKIPKPEAIRNENRTDKETAYNESLKGLFSKVCGIHEKPNQPGTFVIYGIGKGNDLVLWDSSDYKNPKSFKLVNFSGDIKNILPELAKKEKYLVISSSPYSMNIVGNNRSESVNNYSEFLPIYFLEDTIFGKSGTEVCLYKLAIYEGYTNKSVRLRINYGNIPLYVDHGDVIAGHNFNGKDSQLNTLFNGCIIEQPGTDFFTSRDSKGNVYLVGRFFKDKAAVFFNPNKLDNHTVVDVGEVNGLNELNFYTFTVSKELKIFKFKQFETGIPENPQVELTLKLEGENEADLIRVLAVTHDLVYYTINGVPKVKRLK